MATSKNFCSRSDGLDNLGKSGKVWNNVYAKNVYAANTLSVGGKSVAGTYATIADMNKKLNTADLTPNMLYNILHSRGGNFKPSDVTNKGWSALGTFISYYTSKVINNQPSQYGQLINICADTGTEATQLWLDQPSGKLAYRGGNGSGVMNNTAFTYVASATDLATAKSALESSISAVSAKAGIIAGNVSNANSWWVKLGGTIPLIIQGGTTAVPRRSTTSVTFPVKLSKVLSVLVGGHGAYGSSNYCATVGVWSYTTSGMVLVQCTEDGNTGWGSSNWIVIGTP